MRLLLDTHAFLWFIAGDAQLNPYARQLIEAPGNERYLSVASLWEITIKSILRLFWKPEFLLFRNSGFQTELSIVWAN